MSTFRPLDSSEVRYNEQGLVPAIVQDALDGRVLMMAWMNAESLALSLETGSTVFWSRSRGEIWAKGATSGNVQVIEGVSMDCDGDTLLFQVQQVGAGACHTGARSCFDLPPEVEL
jgi:phosphoribosyl-ATP pyrophosphohydrolase/phosphoribosyl-AMP cyclohydrolase